MKLFYIFLVAGAVALLMNFLQAPQWAVVGFTILAADHAAIYCCLRGIK